MVQIAGKYQLVRNENFYEQLRAFGLSEEQARGADLARSTLEITKDGKKLTFTVYATVDMHTSVLILDEEVEEKLPMNLTFRSTSKLDGDKLTVTSKHKDGKTGTRLYTFTDKGLVLVISNSDPAIPTCTRTYTRM